MKLKTLSLVALFSLVASLTSAQTTPAPEPMFHPEFGLALGTYFGEEDVAFDPNALFFQLAVEGVHFPALEAASGVALELGFATLQGNTSYALWQLNRADVIKGRLRTGMDLKFAQATAGGSFGSDFDTRLVTAVFLGKVGRGNLGLEFYFLEENRPIAAALKYSP